MAWKGVHLSQASRLSSRDEQLVIEQADGLVTLALEDLAFVVLDTREASITSGALSACLQAGIVLVATDQRHMPCGITLPFHQHHRQAGVASDQIGWTDGFRRRCWQKLVIAKITNQAKTLIECGRGDGRALMEMAKLVAPGDPDNIEARAARDYWTCLFDDFIRDRPEDLRNKMLNYGYAIVRACLARALVAYGLLPALGLHHASTTNPFNLADDLIEPFRPLVDRRVVELMADRKASDDLTVSDRRSLATLPFGDVRIGQEILSLLAATEAVAASVVRAQDGRSPALLLIPELATTKAGRRS